MKALLLPVLALILGQADEAEALIKKMEEKIAKAKTLQVKVVGEADEAKFKLSGDFLLDEGSKARFDVDGKVGDSVKKATLVSDGKRVFMEATDEGKARRYDAPETFGKLMRLSFARAGFLSSMEFTDTEARAKTDPETGYVVSACKLGAKEKVGEREAQMVTYTVTRKGRNAAVTVWIDAETSLPLKRTLKMDPVTLTETYSDLKLDEKIDAAKFEVPKESK